jgi:hypothetical protein
MAYEVGSMPMSWCGPYGRYGFEQKTPAPSVRREQVEQALP